LWLESGVWVTVRVKFGVGDCYGQVYGAGVCDGDSRGGDRRPGGKCPTLSTIIHYGIQLIMNIFRLSDVICAYTSGHRIPYTFLLLPPHITRSHGSVRVL